MQKQKALHFEASGLGSSKYGEKFHGAVPVLIFHKVRASQ